MANKKVSQLVSKPSVLVTDLFPIADPTTGQLFKTTISDLGTAIGSGVSSVNTLVGAVVLDTDDIQELASPTNRWFTDTRARAALSASSPLAYNSGTGVFSIPAATSSQDGYLTSADWTTFNAKQAALYGTGFVKISGTTISYDNSTYLTTSSAASTYLALAGGTLTGALNGTSATFTGDLTLSATNPRLYFTDTDNNPDYFISNTDGTFTIYDVTNSQSRFTIGTTGNGTFGGNLTVGQIIRSGGTSAQFLKADGSIDSSTYLTTSSASSTYLPLAGGTLTGAVTGTRLVLSQNSADITLSIGNAGTGRAFSVLGTSYFSADIQLGYATNSILKTTALGFITSAIAGTDYQAPLSGTGFVKISGSTISYDNSTYLTTASASSTYLTIATASSTYLPLAGGTLTGALSGTSALFSSSVRANNPSEGATGEGLIAGQSFKIDGTGTSQKAVMYLVSNVLSDTYASGLTAQFANFAGDKAFGFNLNTSGGFELYVKNTSFNKALTIANTGAATFSGQVTSNANFYTASISDTLGARAFGGNSFSIRNNVAEDFNIDIYNRTAGAWYNALKLANNGGAATFSSSVTATSATINSFTAGGGIKMKSTDTTNGRWWLIGNDINAYGDFAILQSAGASDATYTQRIYINPSGNVGIGTTAPQGSYMLTISGDSASKTGGITFRQTSTDTFYMGNPSVTNTTDFELWNPRDGYTRFATNNTERMRITSEGELYWQLSGAAGANLNTGGILFRNNSGKYMQISSGLTTDNGLIYFYKSDGAGGVTNTGSIATSGNLTLYNTTSDYRLKQDFKSYIGLDIINKIKTYDYEWKSDNTRSYGVIAHELQEVLPFAVFGIKDGEQLQQVDYSKIVPVMVQAIKELKLKIETLENK